MKYRFLIAAAFLLILVAGAGIALWAYIDLHAAHAHHHSNDYIEIPKGSSTLEIVNRLESEGIITHKWPLLVYLKLSSRASRLKAGDYRFPSPISPLGVVAKLEIGEQRLGRFTVIEGWTRWDIAAAMAHVPELKLPGSDAALAYMNNVRLIDDLDPTATNLEGYLFPDTYSFPPDATPSTVVEGMVKRFRREWTPAWNDRAKELHLTVREVVTVASLIETEAKLKDERPLVASVIYNRLRKNMNLGVDSTIIYASKLAGKWKNDGHVYKSDVDRVSPYNTRLNRGLPPGPIASPGASSLQAALYPAETTYLYYVRDPNRDDGAHNFYSNEADFERGRQALRDWERNRNAHQPAAGTSDEPVTAEP